MKLEIGKTYEIEYLSKVEEAYITITAEYVGLEDREEITSHAECACCGRVGHKSLHQFNINYRDNEYETVYFGTSCINNWCDITEVE